MGVGLKDWAAGLWPGWEVGCSEEPMTRGRRAPGAWSERINSAQVHSPPQQRHSPQIPFSKEKQPTSPHPLEKEAGDPRPFPRARGEVTVPPQKGR